MNPSSSNPSLDSSPGEKVTEAGNAASPKPTFDRRWLLRIAFQCGALLATVVVALVLVGLAQRIGWIKATAVSSADASSSAATSGVIYSCPMHPEIRQTMPGNCPKCGMTLEPINVGDTAQPSSDHSVHAPEHSIHEHEEPTIEQSGSETAGADLYVCPMMCTPPASQPGKCPVCAMELVKVDGGLTIDSATRRIVGIRTARVEEKEVFRTLRTVGEIAYDEQRVATIAAYVDGRLEKLYADYVGVGVSQGDDLAVLYSPSLFTAQAEYLSSLQPSPLNNLANDVQQLSEVARDKLAELGMTEMQIDALKTSGQAQKRLRIASPIGGTVITKHKLEGDYIKTGEPIYRVVDLSMVWLKLELYPSDAAVVRFGQQVEAELQSSPGEIYTGRVAFIDPIVDPQTRTVSVRVEMTNFDGRLKPGDFATATIRLPAVPQDEVYDPALAGKWISPMHPQIIRNQAGECPICGMDLIPTRELGFVDEPLPNQTVLSVPRSAVLMAGDYSVVYVESSSGQFELRTVALGVITDSEAVILDGLSVGESVATDGNFLIDSQMQLLGQPSLIDPNKKPSTTPPQSTGGIHAH